MLSWHLNNAHDVRREKHDKDKCLKVGITHNVLTASSPLNIESQLEEVKMFVYKLTQHRNEDANKVRRQLHQFIFSGFQGAAVTSRRYTNTGMPSFDLVPCT